MKLTFKDEHRPFVQTFEIVSDGRVLASGVRPDMKAYIESLEAKLAALVEALKQISELSCYDDSSIFVAQRVAEAAIEAAESEARND